MPTWVIHSSTRTLGTPETRSLDPIHQCWVLTRATDSLSTAPLCLAEAAEFPYRQPSPTLTCTRPTGLHPSPKCCYPFPRPWCRPIPGSQGILNPGAPPGGGPALQDPAPPWRVAPWRRLGSWPRSGVGQGRAPAGTPQPGSEADYITTQTLPPSPSRYPHLELQAPPPAAPQSVPSLRRPLWAEGSLSHFLAHSAHRIAAPEGRETEQRQ